MKEYANHSDAIQKAYADYDPLQIQWELIELLHTIEDLPTSPKVICEIGLSRGGTFYVLSQYWPNATLISIDLPRGIDVEGKLFDRSWVGELIRAFAKDVRVIFGNSHDQSTLDQLKAILNGRTIDFLFIDGDHTYEGVKMDFEMYGPLVKGIVAFHDIEDFVTTGPSPIAGKDTVQVKKYWNEIKHNYRHGEIVKSPGKQGSRGIGVIWKD
jgi:cephalosporin hydroxylase